MANRFEERFRFLGPTGAVGRGTLAFYNWIDWTNYAAYEDEADWPVSSSFWRSQLGKRAIHDEWPAQCLLDYVYVWLAEGNARKVCPNYEAYLLAVIGIIEEWYVDGWVLESLKQAHPGRFSVFYWGEESSRGVEGAVVQYDVSPRNETYGHPALSREVFDYYKSQPLS